MPIEISKVMVPKKSALPIYCGCGAAVFYAVAFGLALLPIVWFIRSIPQPI